MRDFVSIDLETTGLDPLRHQVIEVGIVTDDTEVTFSLPFDAAGAEPEALAVNGWGKRPFPPTKTIPYAVGLLDELTNDRHIIGKNPQFDVGFLKMMFDYLGVKPHWHHRLVDVGALTWGWYNGRVLDSPWPQNVWTQPPNVDQVADLVGIPRAQVGVVGQDETYHTALEDARWAHRVFRKIVPVEAP